jgi:hypothetical protein
MQTISLNQAIPAGRRIKTSKGDIITLTKRARVFKIIEHLSAKHLGTLAQVSSGSTGRLNKVRVVSVPATAAAKAADTCTDVQDNDTKATGTHACGRCAGTGKYVVGTENGKVKFGRGVCYRCSGKGKHHEKDRKRNAGFDAFGGAQ